MILSKQVGQLSGALLRFDQEEARRQAIQVAAVAFALVEDIGQTWEASFSE